MLKNLLNLLPAPLVRQLGDSSFESLESRGEIQTWMVATKKPNDGDDDLVEFNFDDFDFDDDSAQESGGIDPDYISRHISRIPRYGDNSRWRLADYLNMFDDLSRDGSLTPEQREAVDNFAAGYQSKSSCEMDFPECQYVANGLDLEKAQKLGDTYRAGDVIPRIGHEVADRISNRLNKMQSQRFPLRK
jgi:hypothetical protein